MKILWFTIDCPQLYSANRNYNGGGWIRSLLEHFSKNYPLCTIGYAFPHLTETSVRQVGNIIYMPLHQKKASYLSKLLNYWHIKNDDDYFLCKEEMLKAIKAFQPDIIQIFGIEHGLASIVEEINIPTIIHLQGLLIPYNNAFFPNGINLLSFKRHGNFLHEWIIRNGWIFRKKQIARGAKHEQRRFKSVKYVSGRTEWDYQLSQLYAPDAKYFFINECLRPIFYQKQMGNDSLANNKITIVSTLSETLYKGLDLILKTASLMKNELKIDFVWKIIGIKEQSSFIHFFERTYKINSEDNNIKYLGVLNEIELKKQLCLATVFVHPSYIDNSPNSVCEAQITGIPVIACNTGGVSSLIHHKITGILIPTNDPYGLAYWIKHLSTHTEFRRQISIKAQKIASERHNPVSICESLMKCYTEILSQQK